MNIWKNEESYKFQHILGYVQWCRKSPNDITTSQWYLFSMPSPLYLSARQRIFFFFLSLFFYHTDGEGVLLRVIFHFERTVAICVCFFVYRRKNEKEGINCVVQCDEENKSTGKSFIHSHRIAVYMKCIVRWFILISIAWKKQVTLLNINTWDSLLQTYTKKNVNAFQY